MECTHDVIFAPHQVEGVTLPFDGLNDVAYGSCLSFHPYPNGYRGDGGGWEKEDLNGWTHILGCVVDVQYCKCVSSPIYIVRGY